MFDLGTMSDVAPMADILFSLGLVLMAILVANVVSIPAFVARDARSARILGGVSGLGIACVVAVLAFRPVGFFVVMLGYMMAFSAAGILLGWITLGWRQAVGRIAGGSAIMALTLVVAHWVLRAPR